MATTNVTVGDSPGGLNLAVYRGDKKSWSLDFADGTTPRDMSGRTWLAQIRADQDETGSTVATMTVDTTSAASGTLVLTIPASESALLVTGTTKGNPTPGKATYFWDLQATSSTDATDVKTWLAGSVKVTGDVSVSA